MYSYQRGAVFRMYEGERGGSRFLPDYELTLNAGDKIFVYTDGIPEATSENNKLYGMDQMIDALNTNPSATPKETIDFVRASVDRFVGTAEQFDDLTMVCLEYKGSAVPSQG